MYRARGWALASLDTIEQCAASGQTQGEMLAELERGDGCQMYGYLEVNKGERVRWLCGRGSGGVGRSRRAALVSSAQRSVVQCNDGQPVLTQLPSASAHCPSVPFSLAVAGNFHFAPGKSFQHAHMHIHDLAAFPAQRFNVSHVVTQLSFGEPFPGVVNPLDGAEKMLGLEDGLCTHLPTHCTALPSQLESGRGCGRGVTPRCSQPGR